MQITGVTLEIFNLFCWSNSPIADKEPGAGKSRYGKR
jgi:hypothetical protein